MRDHVINLLFAIIAIESCALAFAVACAAIALAILAVNDEQAYRRVTPKWVQRWKDKGAKS